ncbi:tubulin/FtsZ family, GTPase domain-containing protein [Besnoitia besnoiti]|uniref:Tubulin alpha chain n=1 Tax=Besnoitia besnoiti TaxID=94643 RepID=A0A2A9MPM1_BESBE|nr:tubulin/FtsZ family, GTPase domain-containing protein [Besnoitia besnoiti]PFH38651.1 tubulin/FtsZ family, GTPase domain-containing protein [Besnoitia besnoiti]
MPREVITVQCGQAGEQLGSTFWELLLAEHGLTYEGGIGDHNVPDGCQNNVDCFFYEAHTGRRVPRSAMIDLDTAVQSTIDRSPMRHLFDYTYFVSNKEDASSNYARGYIGVGRAVMRETNEAIRRQAEMCDSLQCFFLCRSLGGGTGSGLGSLVLESIADEFGKKYLLDTVVWPSESQTSSVVEPYNAMLAVPAMSSHSSAALLFDNAALFGVCRNLLNVEAVFYTNLNQLVAQVLSAVTLSTRFEGSLNSTVEQTLVNTVPYPEVNFLTASLAPLANRRRYRYERASTKDITMESFLPSRCLAEVNCAEGRFIACHLMYRGDVTPRDVQEGIVAAKNSRAVRFVDWMPTGFKCSLNNRLLCVSRDSELAPAFQSCCMFANNTAVTSVLERTLGNARKMFSKRAFVNWFVAEGLEEGEFSEADERLQQKINDYNESVADVEYYYKYAEPVKKEREEETPQSTPTTAPSSPTFGDKRDSDAEEKLASVVAALAG